MNHMRRNLGTAGFGPRKGKTIGLSGGRKYIWADKGKWLDQARPSRETGRRSLRVKWVWRPKKKSPIQINLLTKKGKEKKEKGTNQLGRR